MKVSLLQDSFVRELWNRIGKRLYLEMIHPLVISNLYNSPDKISASAASVLLIGSSEELGAPVTVHQVRHDFFFLPNCLYNTLHLVCCVSEILIWMLTFPSIQTILPLINYFGKGICTDGIEVLVRIGTLYLLVQVT